MEKAPRFPRPHTPATATYKCPSIKERSGHEQTSPIDLLTFAGHVVVPVHERALRVIAPGPDVELEE